MSSRHRSQQARAAGGAGEGEVVPRVREEGAQGFRVPGAVLVQVEKAAAPAAAVAAAGEDAAAQVAGAQQVVFF